MKQFIKFIFASCLGTVLALGLIILIFIVIGTSSAPSHRISQDSVLELKFDQMMPELTDNVSQGGFTFSEVEHIGLNDVTKLIRHAIEDDNIKGILLKTESVSMNPTAALSLSKIIKEFAASGKFVKAYGNYFTQMGYLLASNADTVVLNPNGVVDLRGFGYLIPYFKDFSEKTDINFDVYYAGTYKSAIEPYYRSESSEANRFQTHEFLDEFQRATIGHIQSQRPGLVNLRNIMVEGQASNAGDALSLGLVDALSYWTEFEKGLSDEMGVKEVKFVDLLAYSKAVDVSAKNHADRIAVVYAEGEIAFSGDEKGIISIERYGKIFDRIKKNKKIKAVVLRVNSPGGSSFTSDLIWKKIEELKEDKYVIASFGNYAASGGYYISAGCDKIVSEPTTLTGSIGVFSMIPDMSEFFENKMGINWDTIGTGKRTFMYSLMVPRSQSDDDLLKSETERTYAQFKKIVSEGRQLDPDKVEELAQGRVWSGRTAVLNGLVDTLGTLDDALAIAAHESGLTEYKVLEYPIITKTFYEQLLTELMAGTEVKMGKGSMGDSKWVREINALLKHMESTMHGPQARLPFHLMEW